MTLLSPPPPPNVREHIGFRANPVGVGVRVGAGVGGQIFVPTISLEPRSQEDLDI